MRIKICGLTEPLSLHAAIDNGAAYIGFVFFAQSPRNISVSSARALALQIPPGLCKVALTVDASNELLDQITQNVPIDMFQLHGHETPARIEEIRGRYRLPIMKAIGIKNARDLEMIDVFSEVCDQILCDTKPSKNSILPGGTGQSFDWTLLAGRRWSVPWMLAGGLTSKNVGKATSLSNARQVDVSSAVESAPGVKDIGRIVDFIKSAKGEQNAELI